jgi:hypothetical protein
VRWLWAAIALAALIALVASLTSAGGDDGRPSRASPPAPGSGTIVWAIGDGASGSKTSQRLAERAAADDPAFVLYLGDVYESGTPTEFREHVKEPYAAILSRMLPTPGNHDWPNHERGYDRFWKKVRGTRMPYRYAKRAGGWEIISLNSEDALGEQAAWLEKKVRAPGTCRLAFWHRARRSAGAHGDQRDVDLLWQPLVGHAALVVNGHDHDLQRMAPRDGIVELISGAGGKSHYDVDTTYDGLEWSDDTTYGALRLGLKPGLATAEFVAVDGRVLDRSTVRCTP